MTKLTDLPSELLADIVACLDQPSLKQLRCASRRLDSFTAPRIFETLHIFPNDPSNRKFNHILKDERLRGFVQGIYLTSDSELVSMDLAEGDDEEDDDERENVPDKDKPFSISKEQALSLGQLPHLRHAVLRFEPYLGPGDLSYNMFHFVDKSLEFRVKVLERFFSSLSSVPARLHSLAIGNMHCVCPNTELLATITEILQGLQALRLNIVNSEVGGAEYLIHTPHLIEDLPSTWLKPTMSTLKHLALYNDQPFGFYPKLDLSGIHFPRLRSLVLGNFSFCHDVHIDWILSHSGTLRELYLDACKIVYAIISDEEQEEFYHPSVRNGKWEMFYLEDYDVSAPVYWYSSRWYDYLTLFRERLLRLRHFGFGKTKAMDGDDDDDPLEKEQEIVMGLFEDRYMLFERTNGFETIDSANDPDLGEAAPSCLEEDKDALYALLREIGQSVGELNWNNEDLVEIQQ